jgi:hypothetical protein
MNYDGIEVEPYFKMRKSSNPRCEGLPVKNFCKLLTQLSLNLKVIASPYKKEKGVPWNPTFSLNKSQRLSQQRSQ